VRVWAFIFLHRTHRVFDLLIMGTLTLQHLAKRYDDWELLIDLHVHNGEFMTLLGPSGCGKTTTLRLIAGFLQPDEGHIMLDHVCLDTVPPFRRNIGVVFQEYALFPHMTVFQNIAFGMKMRQRYTKQMIQARVEELLAVVGLDGYARRYPDQLSGGEQQRIALLRALAPSPSMLLLDEPLSALDFQLRKRLRQEIRKIQRQFGITTVYVTHDQEEAMSISDRITVMKDGGVQQIGAPIDIYQHPQTAHVAEFIGISNILSGHIIQCDAMRCFVQVGQHTLEIPVSDGVHLHDEVTVFFRPEDCALSLEPGAPNAIRGTVAVHEYLGAEILTTVQTSDHQAIQVSEYIKNMRLPLHEGCDIFVNIPADACHLVKQA